MGYQRSCIDNESKLMKLFRYYQRAVDGGAIEPFEDDDGHIQSTTEERSVTDKQKYITMSLPIILN